MRRVWIAVAGVGVAVGLVLAVLLARGGESAEDAARGVAADFLAAWDPADEEEPAEAADLTDDPEAAASLLASVTRNLAPADRTDEVGEARAADPVDGAEAREVPYTAVYDLGGDLAEWRVEAVLTVYDTADGWRVRWDPTALHPELAEDQTLVRRETAPDRAPILAADDTELAAVGTVWNITAWPAVLEDEETAETAYAALDDLDVGLDLEALAERVEEAEPDQAVPVVTLRDEVYEEHRDGLNAAAGLQFEQDNRPLANGADSVLGGVDAETGEGTSGLQARYDDQLRGEPQTEVVIADRETGGALETLVEGDGGAPGEPVRTTLDPAVQQAAEDALEGQDQEGSIAVVRPSTGEVLALADEPTGYARSAEGAYAPGSGFKVVTTAALLEGGATAEDVLGCPQESLVDGQRFHNQDEFELGPDTTLHEAFIQSCNTTFIENRDAVDGAALVEAAAAFGLGGDWDAGAGVYSGELPEPESDNELAASLIGQGRLLASPLAMAAVAGTVAEGTFHQPVVVPDAVGERHEPAVELAPETVAELREMMRATVTDGTASALAGVPGGAHAKTGTAEFATGEDGELSTHAWLIGYVEEADLAFAVLLEDGGSGGSHAGPVAAALLESVG